MANPLESFIKGQQQGFQMSQARQQAPILQRERQLDLQGRELQSSVARAKLLSNAIDSIQAASPDPAQRMQLAQQAAPELQRLGISLDPQTFEIDNFTDEGLAQVKSIMTGFIPKEGQDLTAFERERRALLSDLEGAIDERGRLKPLDQLTAIQQAAAINLGLTPRAGGLSAQERTAMSPQLTQQVAQSQAQIAGQKAFSSEQGKITGRELTQTGQIDLEAAQIDVDSAKRKLEEGLRNASASSSAKSLDAETAIDNINTLLKGGYKTIYGLVEGRLPEIFRGQDSLDALALRDQVVGLLSLENRQKLKGQGTITDQEAATLERAATVLSNPTISDTLAEQELGRVKEIFSQDKFSQASKPDDSPKRFRYNPQTGRLE